MALAMNVHAYRGVDDAAFREPIRHHYNASWSEGPKDHQTVRFAVCNGPLMLQMHEADADAESYVLSCGSCARRVLEIHGFSIDTFLDKYSVDPLNDGQMVKPRDARSDERRTGYLTPDYLRWCGVDGEVLERVKERGPQYCWKKK